MACDRYREPMLRRLLRLGFTLGIVGAIAFLVVKALRSRTPEIAAEPILQAVADAPPKASDAWTGAQPAEPVPAPTDAPMPSVGADLWIAPDSEGGCPSSHPIKAKLSSSIFHQPGGMNYERTNADRCYLDAAAAEADGLRAAKR